MIGNSNFTTKTIGFSTKRAFVSKMIGTLNFPSRTFGCSIKKGICHQNDRKLGFAYWDYWLQYKKGICYQNDGNFECSTKVTGSSMEKLIPTGRVICSSTTNRGCCEVVKEVMLIFWGL